MLLVNRVDVLVAMGIAGAINLLMLIIAASLFHRHGVDALTLEDAHAELGDLAGGRAALAFALALLASGLASTSVGTLAGQVVMQGFLARCIPLVLRRLVTMAPSLAGVIAALITGLNVYLLEQTFLPDRQSCRSPRRARRRQLEISPSSACGRLFVPLPVDDAAAPSAPSGEYAAGSATTPGAPRRAAPARTTTTGTHGTLLSGPSPIEGASHDETYPPPDRGGGRSAGRAHRHGVWRQ
jgi:hypothetical protein